MLVTMMLFYFLGNDFFQKVQCYFWVCVSKSIGVLHEINLKKSNLSTTLTLKNPCQKNPF